MNKNRTRERVLMTTKIVDDAHLRSLREDTSAAPLLYSREQAAKLLGGISVATLIRYEAMGFLRPMRLNRSSRLSKVFYRRSDLLRFINDGELETHNGKEI